MIKYSRAKIIAFDLDEALSFTGESGPYLQYAAVRAANIFGKLQARDGLTEEAVVASLGDVPAGVLEDDDVWGLVLEAARLDEVVEQAVRAMAPSLLAKPAVPLAQASNTFYRLSDGEIVEVIAVVALNILTNLLGKATRVEIDFPKVALMPRPLKAAA